MKNFINVRVQAYNHNKQLNILKHNARKIKSLSEGAFVEYVGETKHKTNYVILDNNDMFDLNDKSIREILYTSNKNIYEKDRKLHNEKMYARRQRNLINEQATWLEGIFTFSEAIHKDLGNKYNLEELSKVANDCAKHLAKEMGSELRYLVVHQDEKTLHFHLAFKNFDDNGYSIFHKIKNKETLSRFQDIAFEHFKALGMQRGISKEITGKNYQTISNYYKSKEIELKTIISSLQQDIKQIQEAKKDIKNNFDLSIAEKKQELDKYDLEIKSLRNTMNEYKTIKNDNDIKLKAQQDEISAANDTLIGLNKQITTKEVEVNSFQDVVVKNKDIIDNLINNNITKNIVKQDVVINLDELKKDVNNLVNKTLKIDIKAKELNNKDLEIKQLKEDIANKDKEIALKDKTIEKATLHMKNLEKAFMVNYKQLEAIKRDFKIKVANRVRRLNLINKLKRSNIANKIRLRLSKRLNSNTNLNQRDR